MQDQSTDSPEEWRDVVGYENLYEVSNLGRVRSLHTRFYGRILSHGVNHYRHGQRCVGLTRDKQVRNRHVSRLVAIAFIPNPQDKPQVNHLDGDQANNRVSNLEWATCSENIRHAYATGLNPHGRPKGTNRGETNGMSKLTDDIVREIRASTDTLTVLGVRYGCHPSVISWAKRGITWKHVK